jgi:Lon protease-like protein
MKRSAHSEPLKLRLAAWLASGGSIAAFARANPQQKERTYRAWSKLPEVQAEIARQSAEMVQTIIHRLTTVSAQSTTELQKLLSDPDPNVRLGAVRTALRTLIPIAKFADIDRRLSQLEEENHGEH